MKIKVLVMDVDGTMTDGKIYMGMGGEQFKSFDVKDGYGIHEILPLYGVTPAIITGRKSQIVLNRAKELEIKYVFQDVRKKENALFSLSEELQCNIDEMAYIGDDMIDIKAMKLCGVRGCPADAAEEVKKACSFISTKNGGNGAVREFIEWLVAENMTEKVI